MPGGAWEVAIDIGSVAMRMVQAHGRYGCCRMAQEEHAAGWALATARRGARVTSNQSPTCRSCTVLSQNIKRCPRWARWHPSYGTARIRLGADVGAHGQR